MAKYDLDQSGEATGLWILRCFCPWARRRGRESPKPKPAEVPEGGSALAVAVAMSFFVGLVLLTVVPVALRQQY